MFGEKNQVWVEMICDTDLAWSFRKKDQGVSERLCP